MRSMEAVIDVPEKSRFEIYVGDARAGTLDYSVSGRLATLPSTVVEPAYGGQGLGGTLVRGALDALRDRGLAVRPTCSFVRDYIASHPEYQDLVEEA